jgi:flagellar biosynthesis/type III secretory pathway protein FliH
MFPMIDNKKAKRVLANLALAETFTEKREILDRLYREGHSVGHKLGYKAGEETGYDAGYTRGYDIGQEDGREEGQTSGYNLALDHAADMSSGVSMVPARTQSIDERNPEDVGGLAPRGWIPKKH